MPPNPPAAARFSAAAVSVEPDRSAHSFILTGKPGIGKTWFVSTIDRVFILPLEEGLKGASPNHRPAHFTQVPRNVVELEQAIDAFSAMNAPGEDKRRPYGHLALDSLSGIEVLVNDAACAEEGVKHMEGKDYGKVYEAALPVFQRLQRKLDAIRRTGTHVWVIAHAQEVVDSTEDGDTFRRWDLAFRGPTAKAQIVRNAWRQWADHVLFIDWDTQVKSAKGKRTVGKLKARILRTRESGFAFAKTRSRIADTLPATWEDLRKAMAAGSPAPDARLRAQIDELLPKLPEEDAVAIRADLAKATGSALSAVLSRAQGMYAVALQSAQEDAPAETVSTEPVVELDEEPEPAAQVAAVAVPVAVVAPAAQEPAPRAAVAAVAVPVAVAAPAEPVEAAAPAGDDLSAPQAAEPDERELLLALANEAKRFAALAESDEAARDIAVRARRDLKSVPDLLADVLAHVLCRRFDLATTITALNALVPDVKAAALTGLADGHVRQAFLARQKALKGAKAA